MRTEDFGEFVQARHPGTELQVFDDGWDHLVVATGNHGYRLVRDEADREATPNAEQKLLARLGVDSPVRVPSLELREEEGFRYGSFEFIPGVQLLPQVFETLAPPVKRGIARDIAAFLSHIHAIPVSEGRSLGLTEEPHAWGDWLALATEDVRPLLSPATMHWVEGLFAERADFVSRPAPGEAVIHGDMTGYHLIFDPEAQRLAGIIDFADAAIGDPAQDFCFEAPFGRAFLDALYEDYTLPRADDFDLRRLLYETRTTIFDLQHALGLNEYHPLREPDREEIARLVDALNRMRAGA